eukprot:PITA_33628
MLENREIIAKVLPFGGSDHWPIQLELEGFDSPKNKPFRFENIWLSHPDFINNIEKWWAEDLQIQGMNMFILYKRLQRIKFRLKESNKEVFGNIFVEKKAVEAKLEELNQALITMGFDKVKSQLVDKHHQEWENLCKQEEIFWRQKSRIQWLKERDRQLQTSHKNIEEVLAQHFRSITKENNPDREQCIREITNNIPKLVTREDNFNLNKPVTKEEVSEIIKDMLSGKAPAPYGFNLDFLKACLNIVKQVILNVVEDSRKNRTILRALNASFISLIPKHDSTFTADKFRAISLCSMVYKIISKVLASRLKPLLPSLISGEQFGYVEGRQILNNIILAQETVHMLTSKKYASMIMQLHIAKGYDNVNWSCIKRILDAFGFDHNWIRWVMALVTSSSFSILVNGSPSVIFTPSRAVIG